MKKKNVTNITIIILCCVIGAGYWYYRKVNTPVPAVEQKKTAYFLYSEKDSGSEITTIPQGAVVIIQLPRASYTQPVTITQSDGTPVSFLNENVADSIALSFTIQSKETITVHGTSLVPSKDDFTLVITPQ
jgi:hypothetical protein